MGLDDGDWVGCGIRDDGKGDDDGIPSTIPHRTRWLGLISSHHTSVEWVMIVMLNPGLGWLMLG